MVSGTDPRIAAFRQWLLEQGRLLPGPGPLLAAACARAIEDGVKLMRATVQVRTLHPEVSLMLYIWHRPELPAIDAKHASHPSHVGTQDSQFGEQSVQEVSLRHGAWDSITYLNSPFYVAIEQDRTVRCTIAADQREFEYPILEDLHRAGATGYVALPMSFSVRSGCAAGFATDRPGGFNDEDVAYLEAMMQGLSGTFEMHSERHVTRSLLRTYLGKDPGDRVQAGQVQPGDVLRVHGAIWFSDLRGFTELSARMEARPLIAVLNTYFGEVAAALDAHGGEILKFIGDALLVLFPTEREDDGRAACERAVRAALDANSRLDTLNAQRKEAPLDHGIGLHFGTAEYGNIGSQSRLDFTVIGRDVNLSSRIAGCCPKLGRRVVASQALVDRLSADAWEPLGQHTLKGISLAQALYGLKSAA